MRGTFRARVRRSMLELLDNIDLPEDTVEHLHYERNHQDKGKGLLFPAVSQDTECKGPM